MLGVARCDELSAAVRFGRIDYAVLVDRIGFGVLGVLPLRRRRCAESRNFDDFIAEMHVRQPESATDEPAIAKQAPDFVRQRVRRHVEILRSDAEEQITDRATDQKALITCVFEAIKHLQRVRRYRRPRYRMLGARDH